MPEQETVVVIGAGILGLTAALRLQERISRTTTILLAARDFPSDTSINYASPWAGAHYRPIPATTPQLAQEDAFARITYDVLKQEAVSDPAAGILFMDGYDYLQIPDKEHTELQGGYANIDGFRVLQKHELPPRCNWGAVARTWCLNSPVYCAHLLRKFILKGGNQLRYQFSAAEEAFWLAPNVKTVINCSGIGFGDPASFITRGQTCLVSNPCDRTISQQNADGTSTFCIPRPLNGGTIIGGTKEPNDWTATPSLETRKRILSRAAEMLPSLLNENGTFDVITDIVGRRPTRHGGMRLEVERVGDGSSGKRIVHAYGAGGRSYEVSWGVAAAVAKMALTDETSPADSKL